MAWDKKGREKSQIWERLQRESQTHLENPNIKTKLSHFWPAVLPWPLYLSFRCLVTDLYFPHRPSGSLICPHDSWLLVSASPVKWKSLERSGDDGKRQEIRPFCGVWLRSRRRRLDTAVVERTLGSVLFGWWEEGQNFKSKNRKAFQSKRQQAFIWDQ